MKILVSMIALAIALAWPAVGEAAQSKKSQARSATATHQSYAQRPVKARRAPVAKPCVVRTWTGCQGWDPDPFVRNEIRRDAGRDDL